ncbi:hypothetical protein PVAP13_5KG555500 [Panicum virgatum]|uniref:4-coumarate--CoA ligase n=2 Tax=Panicum virgatum TaxID=38727 RepID=A0A8T0SXJ4_PANVG|nr:hypothetical protein PVAP13_5KG555500 [Panicum virgatum]
MEVIQEVLKHGSANGVRAAIRADKKSYSLVQLIAASLDVHKILCSKNMTRNGTHNSSLEGMNGTGFLHGARVGIVAKPSPEFVAGVFGTWLSGGVAVPLALSYPEAELLHVMNDSPLDVPSMVWSDISIDFVEGFPRVGGKSVVLTVVDRLSKMVHFVPLGHPYTALTVAQAFFDNIVKLHGFPSSIDISMILSTKEHHEMMENLSIKCSAYCSLLPSITSIPSEINPQEPSSNEVTSSVSSLITEANSSNKIKGDDPALILYTSGTTGKPKGVVHTHKGILSQVQILSEAWGYRSEDQFLHCLPLHHVHGLFNALFAPLYSGSVVEFIPKFSVSGIWQRWRESYPNDASKNDEAITVFTGVPTMYTRLLQGYDNMDPAQQSACSYAAKQLRLMMCGSSALPSPLMKRWEEVTGHRLLERYGMTEFVMALSNPLHGIRKEGTVGKPLPRVEAKIIMDDGTETTTGVGELCIRSPTLFKEYWKRPEVTSESFIDGGFFKTGDTVTVDEEGYFIILGRTNADIMKVGGYKLSALEIEAVLLEHDAVLECAVLGLPDEAYGEVICAIIVPKEDAKKMVEQDSKPALTLEALTNWSKDKLAPYKIPTRLYLWDSLPRNAMGKVNKKELKKLLGA